MSILRSTASIILAAGTSSRMGGGRHKLLLPLNDRPVLAHVIDATLTSQARPIVIVLGHQTDQVKAQLAAYAAHPDIILIENPDYLQGMSTSMRVGLKMIMANGYKKGNDSLLIDQSSSTVLGWPPSGAKGGETWGHPTPRQGASRPLEPRSESTFEKSRFVDSALIILGDQPLITPHIIDTLITTWQTTDKRIVAPLYEGKRGNPILFADSLFGELLEVTGDEGGRSVVERHKGDLVTVELGDAVANYDVDTWEAYQQVVEAWQRKI